MTFAEAFSALRDYAPPSTSLSHQNEANSENNLGNAESLKGLFYLILVDNIFYQKVC